MSDSYPMAFIDGGILQSFASDIYQLHREDILNSLLLAQLAADKKFSKFTQPGDWYGFYGDSLSKLAWQSTGFTFEKCRPDTGGFYLKDIVERQFSNRVRARELNSVKYSIERYNLLSIDSRPRQVFFQNTQHLEMDLELVNAQVSVAWEGSKLSVIGTIFETTQSITSLYEQELYSELIHGDIQIVAYSGELNEAVYQTLRESVIEKLGAKREEFIVAVDQNASADSSKSHHQLKDTSSHDHH